MARLLEPLQLGDLRLKNRVFMPPLTRMRAPGYVPGPLNAEYYQQRASAGLIITEGTLVSPLARGHPFTPGIYNQEQVHGWRLVVEQVHKNDGTIFMQLWHVGRMSHSSVHPAQGLPIAPSVVPTQSLVHNADMVKVPIETPRVMTVADIAAVVEEFRVAAANAKEAGLDGVEIHGANGYIVDQFLQDSKNHRTDEYGGSIANRARLLLEIVDAVCTVWPACRVGVRISPFGTFNEMGDSDTVGLFTHVITELNQRAIGYLHLIEPRVVGGLEESVPSAPSAITIFKGLFSGVLITAGGYTQETAEDVLASGLADAVCFGRHFIANPDLPARFARGAPLNKYNRATFYGGGAEGYTDYPFLSACDSA